MGCYMGCGTKRNKMLWGIVSMMLLLSAIFIAIGMSKVPNCRRRLDSQCKAEFEMTKTRDQPRVDPTPVCRKQFADCLRPWLIMAAIGGVALATALIIMCFMCCCNKTPKEIYNQQQMQGLQMGHVAHSVNPYTYDAQQQQQQQQMPGQQGYAAGSPYIYGQQQQPQQQRQQVQPPPQGYPFAPQQSYQQQSLNPQQSLNQQPSQQMQQGGRPPAQAYPAGTPFMGTPAPQQQQQQQQPYPPVAGPYPGQPASSVPVQTI